MPNWVKTFLFNVLIFKTTVYKGYFIMMYNIEHIALKCTYFHKLKLNNAFYLNIKLLIVMCRILTIYHMLSHLASLKVMAWVWSIVSVLFTLF